MITDTGAALQDEVEEVLPKLLVLERWINDLTSSPKDQMQYRVVARSAVVMARWLYERLARRLSNPAPASGFRVEPENVVQLRMQAAAWCAVYDELEPELAQDSGLGTGVDAVVRVIRDLRSRATPPPPAGGRAEGTRTDAPHSIGYTGSRDAAPDDAGLVKLAERLEARGDNAYVAYIDQLRRDECLGWEIKAERGAFGEAELKAHKNAAELLGRHRALHEAAKELREAASRIAALTGKERA